MNNINYPIDGVVYPSAERAQAALASGSWIASTVGDALRHTARNEWPSSVMSAA